MDGDMDEAAAAKEGAAADATARDQGGKGPSKRRRHITLGVVAVLVVVGIAGGLAYYLHARGHVTTDDAFIDGNIVRVAARERGRLTEVPVQANSRVTAGDLLARIDGDTARAALAVAKAHEAEARAAIGEAEAGITQAKAATDSARSRLQGAEVTARNARRKADRFARIAEKSGQTAISTQQLDDTEAAAGEAESAAATARTQVAAAESRVAAARATLESAKAAEVAASAGVDQAEVDIEHLTITAPIDGQVVQVNANTGSYVSPGTQIMALVPDALFVTANFKETQLADIAPGQSVDLVVDAFPDVAFEGTVQSIQNGAGQAFQLLPPQNATGNFVKVVQRVPVRISIDSPDVTQYPIGPGMSVVPSIRLED